MLTLSENMLKFTTACGDENKHVAKRDSASNMFNCMWQTKQSMLKNAGAESSMFKLLQKNKGIKGIKKAS
jgi:hypothetical protein